MRSYGAWRDEKALPDTVHYHIDELLKCRIEPELLKKMLNLHENEEDQTQTKISVCACGGKDSRRADFDQVSFQLSMFMWLDRFYFRWFENSIIIDFQPSKV